MTTGQKIATLRKQKNYTQENLADLLGISRQSISRWESDIAYPETDKLIRLSELFGCTVDFLLTDKEQTGNTQPSNKYYEYKSERELFGMPLVHINIGVSRRAKGILSVGLVSSGIFSIGLLSFGLISIGLVSIGLLFGCGVASLAFLSCGAFSGGVLSFGALTVGVLSIGAIAWGEFSMGAVAFGNYFAFGAQAYAKVAIGSEFASGSLYQHYTGVQNNFSGFDIVELKQHLDAITPGVLTWVKNIVYFFLGI